MTIKTESLLILMLFNYFLNKKKQFLNIFDFFFKKKAPTFILAKVDAQKKKSWFIKSINQDLK